MVQESLKRHITKRILYAIPVFLLIITMNFSLIHLSGGDPVYILAGEQATDPEYLDRIRHIYGLDRPVHEQFFVYLGKVLRGDLGFSWRYKQSVWSLIIERLPATLLLTVCSMVFATLVGIMLGMHAARKPYSLSDNLITISALTGYSMPVFWLGLMFILVFSLRLNWFPTGGLRTIGVPLSGMSLFIDILHHSILPISVLGLNTLALITRLTRANMLEILGMDYITTARSKGLSESAVFYGHALKNTMLPIVTIVGLQARWLFAGAILTETTFSWPGMGRLLYESLLQRDYPTIMGVLIITTGLVILANLTIDILYSLLDPRIRYKKEG